MRDARSGKVSIKAKVLTDEGRVGAKDSEWSLFQLDRRAAKLKRPPISVKASKIRTDFMAVAALAFFPAHGLVGICRYSGRPFLHGKYRFATPEGTTRDG